MPITAFAEHILGLLIIFAGQFAGNSPYSFESVAACGADREAPACSVELERACQRPGDFRCTEPRWSPARRAWVRTERRESALFRYKAIADSVARVSTELAKDGQAWPGDPETLAMAAIVTAIHESGLREDVQFGHPPWGRGSAGEVCLMQIMPTEVQGQAEALDRCFTVGMRLLARARVSCDRTPGAWPRAMWSLYGTGKTCSTRKLYVNRRVEMFERMRRSEAPIAPDVRELLGLDRDDGSGFVVASEP